MTVGIDRRPVKYPSWWADAQAFADVLATVAEHDWAQRPPNAALAPSGHTVPLSRVATELRRFEDELTDEQWAALDEAGFAWSEPTRFAPPPAPVVDDGPSPRELMERGTLSYSSVVSMDRSLPGRGIMREWIERGLRACAASEMSVTDALGRPDHIVATTEGEFAIGAWARELARAERWGHVTLRSEHIDPELARMLGRRTRLLLRNLGHAHDLLERMDDIPNSYVVTTFEGAPFDIGGWIHLQRSRVASGRMEPSRRATLDAFGIRLTLFNKAYHWERTMAALDQYLAREHRGRRSDQPIHIPYSVKELLPDGSTVHLGHWVATQRHRYTHSYLPAHELAAIRSRNIDLTIRQTPRNLFALGITALDTYIAQRGNPHPAQGEYVELPNGASFPVGDWLASKRQVRKAGQMPEYQEQALHDRGISWEPRREHFETGLRLFTELARTMDPLKIPTRIVVPDGEGGTFDLGSWVCETRRALRSNRLEKATITRLYAAGFVPDAKVAEHQRKMKGLRQYIKKHGHTLVPSSHVEKVDGNPVELGMWVSRIRVRNKQGRLIPELRAELDALGFAWDVFKAEFDRATMFLEQYAQRWCREHPGEPLHVPMKHVEVIGDDAFNLGTWLTGRRGYFKKRGMLPSEAERLYALGCEWADPAKNPAAQEPSRRLRYRERGEQILRAEAQLATPSR